MFADNRPAPERLAAMRASDGSPLLDLVQFYLDDGIVAGPAAAVAQALELLQREGPQRRSSAYHD